jgi:hypothetical protein
VIFRINCRLNIVHLAWDKSNIMRNKIFIFIKFYIIAKKKNIKSINATINIKAIKFEIKCEIEGFLFLFLAVNSKIRATEIQNHLNLKDLLVLQKSRVFSIIHLFRRKKLSLKIFYFKKKVSCNG